MKYRKNNGEIYEGPVITLLDGRIITGETYTRDSVRVHPIIDEPAPVRARNEKGKLKAYDPSTKEVNEAWVGGKAPKKSRKKKSWLRLLHGHEKKVRILKVV